MDGRKFESFDAHEIHVDEGGERFFDGLPLVFHFRSYQLRWVFCGILNIKGRRIREGRTPFPYQSTGLTRPRRPASERDFAVFERASLYAFFRERF